MHCLGLKTLSKSSTNGRSVQCYFPEPQGLLNLIFTGFWRHQQFWDTDFAYVNAADGMAG